MLQASILYKVFKLLFKFKYMKAIQLCALCLMFLLSHLSFGQSFNQEIKKSIDQFEQSLIQKNVNSLDKILHQNLTLGHSNGWIETKNSLLET